MEATETPQTDQLHADIHNYTTILTTVTAINNNGCSILLPESRPLMATSWGDFIASYLHQA
jgi:hypothetical protein